MGASIAGSFLAPDETNLSNKRPELKENDMNLVQTDLSEQALVTAIRANMCGFFHYLGLSFPDSHFTN